MSEFTVRLPSFSWLRPTRSGFRDPTDLLGRVYAVAVVARSLLGLHAVFVNLFFVVHYTDRPLGVVAATAVLIAWHVFISWRLRVPAHRTWPAKSSALAGKVRGRGIMAGTTRESRAAMWLLARMAPPVRGKFSAPITLAP